MLPSQNQNEISKVGLEIQSVTADSLNNKIEQENQHHNEK